MKMKSIFTWLVLVPFIIGLNACKKDSVSEEGITHPQPEDTNVMSVSLNLSTDAIVTRSVENAMPAGSNNKATFQSPGIIAFASANGTIVKKVNIITTTPGTNSTDVQTINLNSGSVIIPNVPAKATQIYVVGNVPAATLTALQAATSIATMKMVNFNIVDQPTSAFSVTLDGLGTLVPAGTGISTGSVTVSPIVSRFEIGKITYVNDNTAPGAAVTAYKLTGIFLNNIYLQSTLAGVNAGLFSGSNGSSSIAAGSFIGSAPYANSGVISDVGSDEINVGGTFPDKNPGSGKVWAYNFFATSTQTPHIVLRLQNIVSSDGLFGDAYQWVTVQKFRDAGNNAITAFDRNKVYRIASIAFTNNNIADVVEGVYSNATVTVTTASWEDATITPDLSAGGN